MVITSTHITIFHLPSPPPTKTSNPSRHPPVNHKNTPSTIHTLPAQQKSDQQGRFLDGAEAVHGNRLADLGRELGVRGAALVVAHYWCVDGAAVGEKGGALVCLCVGMVGGGSG